MNALGYVHLDIKPSNIFIRSTGDATKLNIEAVISGEVNFTLGDYDLSMSPGGSSSYGDTFYLPPEFFKIDNPFGMQSLKANPAHFSRDLYSASLTIYKMTMGEIPWREYLRLHFPKLKDDNPFSWWSLIQQHPEVYENYLLWIRKQYDEMIEVAAEAEKEPLRNIRDKVLSGLQFKAEHRQVILPQDSPKETLRNRNIEINNQRSHRIVLGIPDSSLSHSVNPGLKLADYWSRFCNLVKKRR